MNLEPVMRIIEILLLLPIVVVAQSSHMRNAKAHIRHELAEVRKDARRMNHHSIDSPRRYSTRRKMAAHFTPWTGWGKCDHQCIKSRERYCKVKRKCGNTKHIEEKACRDCQPENYEDSRRASNNNNNNNNNNNAPSSVQVHQQQPITQVQSQLYQSPAPPPPLPPPIPPAIHPLSYPPPPPQIHPIHSHIHPQIHPQIIHSPPIMAAHPIATYPAVAPAPTTPQRLLLPVLQEIREPQEETRDYYVIKKRPKYRKKRKPIVIEVDDYDEMQEEDDPVEMEFNKHYIRAYRSKYWSRKDHKPTTYAKTEDDYYYDNYDQNQKRNLGSVGEAAYDYDDVDTSAPDANLQYSQRRSDEYSDEYDDDELYDPDLYDPRNGTTAKGSTRDRVIFEMPSRYRRVYTKWSKWTRCSQKCTTRRYKKCRMKDICGKEVLREIAYCYTQGSFCQQWLEGQIQKNHVVADIKPIMSSRRKDVMNPNSLTTDFIVSGKGYRGPEYRPLKLKCGLPNIRTGRRNMNSLLKIIGGKPSRKGEWPWQVVIFNRFKEAFCGGTLIAPRWILTAAHCVRKVLYVRLGEHNLDYQDGTEVEYRVVKTIKHPNYDKKTVDSDIALLRLPKPVNATTWIGFSCLPRSFQALPKNVQCTVIGWGKRRNRDQAGTSVLHQAEVPIIPMDNCKAVYYDYTITKNMFCAGHKRGRIDTCAGDSGGPLLCRDTTKTNQPWTIFGITSFGDGCAKKNKFGIYTKVPNYVDWVWSVINCNGNCRSSTNRRY